MRLQDRTGVLGRRERAHRLHEAIRLLHAVAVVAQQVGRLFDVTQRLETVLADLEGHECRVIELALADQVSRAPNQLQASPPAEVSPGGESGAGGGHRVAHVLSRANREARDDDVGVVRRAVLEFGRAPSLLAADQHRIRTPELATDPFHGGVEGRLQLLVVGRQRGVGDLHAGAGGRHLASGASGEFSSRHGREPTAHGGLRPLSHPLVTMGMPKARLRGEKSLAFDGANHRGRVRRPQGVFRHRLTRW